jgi:hypothetical protein
VTKNDLQNLSKIECASFRLNAAVGRIEKAMADQIFSANDKNSHTKLAEELESELIVLRSENARLKLVNESVSERLERVIWRFKNFIEDA